MAESAICNPNKGSAWLVRPDLRDGATRSWFDPAYWGEWATPVESGGRGGAWFIENGSRHWVLREYRRGGFPARLSTRTYLFTGEAGVRSFAEFRLLERLQELGLPAPRPVAAHYLAKAVLGYRAAILVERIPGAVTLPDHPDLQLPDLWYRIGCTIRRFHDVGVDHVDLNVNNILVADETVYLIDFDRCAIRDCVDRRKGWQSNNLSRLRRSGDKLFVGEASDRWGELWDALETGYTSASDWT